MKKLLVTFLLISVFFISCDSNRQEKFSSAALSDSTSIFGQTGDSVKLVKTASVNFKVHNIGNSLKSISDLVRNMGGMVIHQSYSATENGTNGLKISKDSILVVSCYIPGADVRVRVPAENLEEFLYSVTDFGYFTFDSKLDIDDKSLVYLTNILKGKNRRQVLARPDPNKIKALSKLQVVALKDETVDREINNKLINADVEYSMVDINLFQNTMVKSEVISNYVIADYQLPYISRLLNAFSDGWQSFLSFLLAIIHLWVYILFGILVLVAYKYLQQKRIW